MQNALAILPGPVSVIESSFALKDHGGNAFAETFADGGRLPDHTSHTDDQVAAGAMGTVLWGGPLMVSAGAATTRHAVSDALNETAAAEATDEIVPGAPSVSAELESAAAGGPRRSRMSGPEASELLQTAENEAKPWDEAKRQSAEMRRHGAVGNHELPGEPRELPRATEPMGSLEPSGMVTGAAPRSAQAIATTPFGALEVLDGLGQLAGQGQDDTAVSFDALPDHLANRPGMVDRIGLQPAGSSRAEGDADSADPLATASTSFDDQADQDQTPASMLNAGEAIAETPEREDPANVHQFVQSVEGPPGAAASVTSQSAPEGFPSLEAGVHRLAVASIFWERFPIDMAASNTSQVPAFPQDYPTALAIPNDRITATQSAAAAGLDAAVSAPESGERLVIEDQSGLTPRHEFAAVAAKADVEAPSRPIAGAILTDQPTFFVSEWSDNSSLLRTETDLGSPMAPFAFVTSADGSLSARHSAAHFPIPQIVTQLAGALIRNAQGATELALSPEELGRVRLRMEPDAAHPGRMVILISVERPETLELFRRHAGELADAIRAAGYSEADIGFGHEGEDRRPGGQHASAEGAPGRTSDDPDPPPRSARHPAGNNLYLRL